VAVSVGVGAGTGVEVGGTGVTLGGTRVAVAGTGVALGGTGVPVSGTRVGVEDTGVLSTVAVGTTGDAATLQPISSSSNNTHTARATSRTPVIFKNYPRAGLNKRATL
jgi:hypothetical protein